MSLKFEIKTEEITKLHDLVYASVISGERDFDITIIDIECMTDQDFNNYEIELNKLTEMIIGLHGLKRYEIAVNVLTDPIMGVSREVDPKFVICVDCPCVQCAQDEVLFKERTGFENIPPEFYCRKSFLELSFARKIGRSIFALELDDFDHKDWRECILYKGLLG